MSVSRSIGSPLTDRVKSRTFLTSTESRTISLSALNESSRSHSPNFMTTRTSLFLYLSPSSSQQSSAPSVSSYISLGLSLSTIGVTSHSSVDSIESSLNASSLSSPEPTENSLIPGSFAESFSLSPLKNWTFSSSLLFLPLLLTIPDASESFEETTSLEGILST